MAPSDSVKRPSLSRNASSQSATTHPPPQSATAPKSGPADSAANPHTDLSSGSDSGDIIDMETFQQILELDEDDPDLPFSRETVEDYFKQVEATLVKMDTAYEEQDLPELSGLGHFLKGSSAQLGVKKVQESCEEMQNVGALRDEHADRDLSQGEALKRIEVILKDVKRDYGEAEKWLKNYFKMN